MRTKRICYFLAYVGVSCNYGGMATELEVRAQRNLAAIFRAERARLDMDQEDLAVAVESTQATVSRKLRGKSSFNATDLKLYCDALGLDMGETITLAMSDVDQEHIHHTPAPVK